VPITFLLADALDIEPIPLVIIEVVASNIRGTAILIGDPPNIIIAGATGFSFDAFIVKLAPIAAIALVAITAVLYLSYRPRLRVEPRARRRLMDLNAARSIEDRDELIRTVPILVATILVFFLHKALGLEPATVALAGATAMMLVTRQPLDEALAGIEWRKLFFFLGLFVMVGALEETGAIRELADGIATLTDGDRTAELRGIAWASALGSGCRQLPLRRHDGPRRGAAAGRQHRRRRLLVGARDRRLLRRQRQADCRCVGSGAAMTSHLGWCRRELARLSWREVASSSEVAAGTRGHKGTKAAALRRAAARAARRARAPVPQPRGRPDAEPASRAADKRWMEHGGRLSDSAAHPERKVRRGGSCWPATDRRDIA
jgi:hypothetical protein